MLKYRSVSPITKLKKTQKNPTKTKKQKQEKTIHNQILGICAVQKRKKCTEKVIPWELLPQI